MISRCFLLPSFLSPTIPRRTLFLLEVEKPSWRWVFVIMRLKTILYLEGNFTLYFCCFSKNKINDKCRRKEDKQWLLFISYLGIAPSIPQRTRGVDDFNHLFFFIFWNHFFNFVSILLHDRRSLDFKRFNLEVNKNISLILNIKYH